MLVVHKDHVPVQPLPDDADGLAHTLHSGTKQQTPPNCGSLLQHYLRPARSLLHPSVEGAGAHAQPFHRPGGGELALSPPADHEVKIRGLYRLSPPVLALFMP